MKFLITLITTILISTASGHLIADDDEVEMETTFIKGNKELPQVLYIVPWQELKTEQKKEKTLILHSLFGDAFEPVIPKNLRNSTTMR
ncbi:hypothetical protein MNBD_GAMMA18-279 [hydrothermal vent metagenome]|uniref:Uncharacterized protein n=1 Tax=hydrothermal vent metagenome TaxID=652676 RepID=A0A3B0Z723_9ZZZZ